MDRGLLLGDGVFETLRCYNGKPFALSQHLDRLSKGLAALEISYALNRQSIFDIIQQLLSENSLLNKDASVRITITRGEGERGLNPPAICKPTLLITVSEHIQQKNKPLNLCISKYIINEHSPLSQYKTLNYLDNSMARKEAINAGFNDAILLNTQGNVVCTTAANIFLIIDNELHTPALTCGTLPGITRNIILELIQTHERSISTEDLSIASDVFICNSLIEIQPVSHIDNFFSATQPTNQILSNLAYRINRYYV